MGHVEESVKVIEEHVKEEIEFWEKEEPEAEVAPVHRVFVGGFSQGGVMAMHYALSSPTIPAGVISLSGYMLRSTPLTNHKKFPALIMHG